MTRPRGRPSLPRRPAARAGADIGPPERYRHGDIIQSEPGEEAGVQFRRVMTQNVLDRHLARDQIGQRQFDAGMKLLRLWRASGASPRVIASYGPRVHGPRIDGARDMSERQAVLRGSVTEVLRAMGPLSGILVHVCLCDEAARDWAKARGHAPQGGIVVLRLALDALADHWRL